MEFNTRSQAFIDGLDVDDVIAHLLVTEGFSSIEEVAYVPVDELMMIEGFDEDIAEELRARARSFLERRDEELAGRAKELGINPDLGEVEGVSTTMMVKLGEKGVLTRDDLADMTGEELRLLLLGENTVKDLDKLLNKPDDELREMLRESTMSPSEADQLIVNARAHWFEGEEEAAAADGAEAEAEAEDASADAPASN